MENRSVVDAASPGVDVRGADAEPSGGKFSASYVAHRDSSTPSGVSLTASIASMSSGSLSKLKKELGLFSAVSLIAGTIIGSGIFLTPNDIVEQVGSPGMALLVWLISGLVVLCASLCYAELGTAFPASGGEYTYLRNAFGGLPAFLYAWVSTLVVRPVSGGIILLTFADYVTRPFYGASCEPPAYTSKTIAIAALVFITCVGCLSAKWSANVSSILLVVKMLAIFFLIILGIVSMSEGHVQNLKQGFQNTTINIGTLAFAFYDSLWAYDGWNNANYVTGELRDPKLLPIALVIAVPLVIVCYLLVNVSYLSILSMQAFIKSSAIAVDASQKMVGDAALVIVPMLVAASCVGAANGSLFAGSRVSAESARRGDLPRVLGLVHDSHCTPIIALIFQTLMSMFYILAVPIKSLILFFSFVSWLFYGACMVIVIVLRYRQPTLPRVFKVPLVLPVIVAVFAVFLVVTPFYQYPIKSSSALGFMVFSVPLYFIFVSRRLLSRYSSKFDRASDWTVRAVQFFLDVS